MTEQTPLLKLENIKVVQPHQTIEIYTSTLFPGIIYQIQGPNGAGKTTLMDVFAHEAKIKEGTIYFEGKSLAKKQYSTKIVKKLISYIRQEDNSFKKTPLATLLDAVKAKRLSSPLAYRTVMELMDEFSLSEIANTKMSELSLGIRRKILLLTVFLNESKVIIIDDPRFESLDENFMKKYVSMLKKNIKQDNKTLVLASAQSLVRHRLVDITLVMNKGHIIRVEKSYQRKPNNNRKPKRPESKS